MKKSTLIDFINKFSLNGIIEKCKIVSNEKDKTLKTSALTDVGSMLSSITLSNWTGFGDAEIGIGDADKVKKELRGFFDEDVDLRLNFNNDKTRVANIEVISQSNKRNKCFIKTCDIEIIKDTAGIKKIPDFDVEILFDDDLKNRFFLAKSALPDNKGFTVMVGDDKKIKVVIGYNTINTSRYEMDVKTTNNKNNLENMMTFRADYLKEILDINSETDSTLYISNKGLAYLHFVSGDFDCKYLLKPMEQDY